MNNQNNQGSQSSQRPGSSNIGQQSSQKSDLNKDNVKKSNPSGSATGSSSKY